MTTIHHELIIDIELNGLRLDQALAKALPDYPREQHKRWIQNHCVTVNDKIINRPRHIVKSDDSVVLNATLSTATHASGEPIELNIIHEDDDIIIINKPAGLVVHPGAGNPDGTLVNALIHHHPTNQELPRAGIIHRLDKDTTGLLVIAKNLVAHSHLVDAMQKREISREYLAIIQGCPVAGDTIDAPIGRHPSARTKMAVNATGKPAITHYRIKQRFLAHTLLKVILETGRTHQIRVHLTHRGFPLIGDKTYRRQIALSHPISRNLAKALADFPRQALHAHRLSLSHPASGELLSFEAPIPEDMGALIQTLAAEQNTAQ